MINHKSTRLAFAAAVVFFGISSASATILTETLVSNTTAEMPSVAVDPQGRPHVSYCNDFDKTVVLADWNGSSWDFSSLPHGLSICTSDNPLRIRSDDARFIAIASTDGIILRQNSGSGWSAPDVVDSTGVYPALVLGGVTESPHVVYLKNNNEIVHARKLGASPWEYQSFPVTNAVEEISAAVDSEGRAHIVYYDATDRDLEYARWTGSAWAHETVDSVGDVGSHPSIALDSADRPYIAYGSKDPGTRILKLARWTGSAWNLHTVDGDVDGGYTSIAIDAQHRWHVSYGLDLGYAQGFGDSWQAEARSPSNPYSGQSSSLALTPEGKAIFAHQGGVSGVAIFVSSSTLSIPLPQPPSNLVLKSRTDTSITWGWQDNHDAETAYRVLMHVGLDRVNVSGDLPANAVEWTQTGLAPLQNVTISVEMETAAGPVRSTYSISGQTLEEPPPPAPPTNIITKSVTHNSITWGWTDNESRETAYRVLSAAGANLSGDLPANTVEWTQTGLSPEQSVTVKVEMATPLGTVQSTHTATAVTLPPPPPITPSAEEDVNNIRAYPNPFQPSKASSMTFDQLPAGSKITVYTLRGERVKELTADGAGQAVWFADNEAGEKVASGVYFVFVEGPGGKKTIKVGVQR